jgi:hypothetical protein
MNHPNRGATVNVRLTMSEALALSIDAADWWEHFDDGAIYRQALARAKRKVIERYRAIVASRSAGIV